MTEPAFQLYLDSASLDELATILPHRLVYGVTTNPSLMLRAGVSRDGLAALVDQALTWGVRAVQVQVESTDAEGIERDARAGLALGPPGSIVTKIPATRVGFGAGARLADEGLAITYTAVYAPEQVLFAALADAAYAAP